MSIGKQDTGLMLVKNKERKMKRKIWEIDRLTVHRIDIDEEMKYKDFG